MTLGQKLTFYRKKNGLTQQQLGDQINVTAQAVSKWENDLAEPDLHTLMKLSELYATTLDALVSEKELDAADAALYKEFDAESIASMVSENIGEQMKEAAGPHTIGFCTACGISVTEDNIGTSTPKVLCKACKEEAERLAAEAKKRAEAEENKKRAAQAATKKAEEEKKAAVRAKRRTRLIKASVFGGIVAALVLGCAISAAVEDSDPAVAFIGLVFAIFAFSFISMLFFEGPVRDVIFNCATCSVRFPGLIFEWSIDGFLWLIGMKLLFAALGFLIGLTLALLGIFLGLIIAPFVYLWFLPHYLQDIKNDVKISNWE